ncbi:MAG: hypothetical protein QJR01_09740 [Kyrpidia sp.]|nr:hypothetical protein [Kyrpidia sp.]
MRNACAIGAGLVLGPTFSNPHGRAGTLDGSDIAVNAPALEDLKRELAKEAIDHA